MEAVRQEVRGQRSVVGTVISQKTRVAVIAHRVGPYHFARLRAAAHVVDVTAIELSGADKTYAWDLVPGADGFKRVTVFENADSRTKPVAEVIRRVRSALDECRPEVVATPGWADDFSLAGLGWCSFRGIPAVMMSETTMWDERRVLWKEWMKRRLVGLCSAALVGGTPHKDYLVKLGMPAERVFWGYDAVENEYFVQGANAVRRQRTEVRGQSDEVATHFAGQGGQEGLQDYETTGPQEPKSVVSGSFSLPNRYFLASARFVEKKNLSRLIEAYARYRTMCEDHRQQTTDNRTANGHRSVVSGPVVPWSLILLGDGPLRSSILDLRSSLGLDDHVLLPGFKQYDELPVYYGLASAFIHASTTEQWGLVVNEAMASGLPVLVSNRCGCAQDLMKEGVNGFTFDPYDVEQLAGLMLRIAGTTDYATIGPQTTDAGDKRSIVSGQWSVVSLEQMGTASREIITHWGPEQFASGLQQAVEMALRIPPPRAKLLDRLLVKALLTR